MKDYWLAPGEPPVEKHAQQMLPAPNPTPISHIVCMWGVLKCPPKRRTTARYSGSTHMN